SAAFQVRPKSLRLSVRLVSKPAHTLPYRAFAAEHQTVPARDTNTRCRHREPKKTSASRGAVGTRRRPPRLTHFEPYAVGPTGREALSRVSHEGPGQGRAVVYSSGISRRA